MSNFTYRSGAENAFLEDKYLTYDDLGLPSPATAPYQIWNWGWNSKGQIAFSSALLRFLPDGLSVTYNRRPLLANTGTDWNVIDAGAYHSMGLKTDGTLWGWGLNEQGQLGDGTLANRWNGPEFQVGGTDWSNVTCGGYHTVAIKTNGSLWAWGSNVYGQLGNNTSVRASSPVQVGALTNWRQVACGRVFSTALKTDGTLWAWGDNAYGQLGQNNIVHRSSPVQVGALTNWKAISSGRYYWIGTTTSNDLWGCGYNGAGVLCLNPGTIGAVSSPIQVSSLTTWNAIACGDYHALGIKTDGTLWSWGLNADGQLGDGTTTRRSSPVQVGALTTWQGISAGGYHSLAIKTDGTLWAWGDTYGGQLGNGDDNVDISSPIQIGFDNTWKTVASGKYFSMAFKYIYE